MRSNEIREWANNVLNQLRKVSNLNIDEFTFLAGMKYRKFLLTELKHVKIPLKGLGIGKQLQWLNNNTKTIKRFAKKFMKLFNIYFCFLLPLASFILISSPHRVPSHDHSYKRIYRLLTIISLLPSLMDQQNDVKKFVF